MTKELDELTELYEAGKLPELLLDPLMAKLAQGDIEFVRNYIKRIKGEIKVEKQFEEEPKEVIKETKQIKKAKKTINDDEEVFIKPMTDEKTDSKNDKILLWGISKASSNALKNYNDKEEKGDKPTKEKEPKKNKSTVRRFSPENDYTYNDIEFLKSELERLNNELDKNDFSDMSEEAKIELEGQLSELIEGLEYMHELQKGYEGEGMASKARSDKGSEKALEIGRKLAEARAKKKAEKEKLNPPVENIEPPRKKQRILKPYYKIGPIPSGHREATEDEAIMRNKVSQYGKYQVDHIKYMYWDKYKILLTDKADDNDVRQRLKGIKRLYNDKEDELETTETKLDNDKYADKHNYYKNLIDEIESSMKDIYKAYSFYERIRCKREGIPYKKVSLSEPKDDTDIIKYSNSKPIKQVEKEVIIDIRTGKPKDEFIPNPPITFIRGKDKITLDGEYFDDNEILLSKYAKALFKKGVVLEESNYKPSDIKKYFYRKETVGGGFIKYKTDKNKVSKDNYMDSDSDEDSTHRQLKKELKQHRRDFEGGKIKIGKFFKNVGHTLDKTFKPTVPILKSIGKQTAKVLIHEGIPIVSGILGQAGGDALAIATGNPELAPIAGQLGQRAGEYGGKKLSKYVSKKTGYGVGGALMIDNQKVLSPSEKLDLFIDRIGERLEKAKDKYGDTKERDVKTLKKISKATKKRVLKEVEEENKPKETMGERMARLRAMRKPKKKNN